MQALVDSIPASWKESPVILLADSVRIDFSADPSANDVHCSECSWYYINKRNPALLDIIELYDYSFVETAPQISVDIIYPDGTRKSMSPWEIARFKPADEGGFSTTTMENSISIPKYQEKMLIRLKVGRTISRPAYRASEYLRDEYHCLKKDITLSWPADVQLKYRITNAEGLSIDTARSMTDQKKNVFTVHGRNLQRFPVDQQLRYPEQWFAGLHFSLPPSGKHSLSWQELGDHYLEQIKTSLVSSPEIKKLAASISETGRADIIRKAFQYVQKNIRYFSDEEKVIYAIVPRPASEVFAKGYGDCKEMAGLLKVILNEKGIPSDLALVKSKWKFQLIDSVPALGYFDHMILYVPDFDGAPLFLDPTVDNSHTGNSYYHSIFQKSFILEKGLSRIVEIMPREGRGRLIVSTSSMVEKSPASGSWEMHGTVVLRDLAAFLYFPVLKEMKGEENNPAVINILKSMFTIEPFSVSCAGSCTDSITLGFACSFSKNYLKIDKGGFLLETPSVFGGPTVFTTIRREGPRVFEKLEQEDTWTLPEGFEEMESAPLAHRFATGSWARKGRAFTRTFALLRTIVPVSREDEARQFIRQKDDFTKVTVWHK